MSTMTEKMGQASAKSPARTQTPKKGERFRCTQCGMEIQVTADCKCSDPDHVQFQCCGQDMQKA